MFFLYSRNSGKLAQFRGYQKRFQIKMCANFKCSTPYVHGFCKLGKLFQVVQEYLDNFRYILKNRKE